MKNNKDQKKSLIRQLVSGTVYVALAAVVIAVTVNTTVGLISDGTDTPQVENTGHSDTTVPTLPEIPRLSLPEYKSSDLPSPLDDSAVSDTVDGVNALVTDTADETSQIPSDDFSKAAQTTGIEVDKYGIPVNANLGFDKFVKPCGGYISREFSADVPVYSPTMSDYRTHQGIDVVGDIGSEVVCVNGGIVKNIYNDDLFGVTVEITNRSGYTMRYSNLLPELDAQVKTGAIIKTGDPIGGIGESAICEAAETPHVHLEIYDAGGNPLDPEQLIQF